MKVGHTSKPLLQQQQHPSTNYTNLQYKHGNYLYCEKQDILIIKKDSIIHIHIHQVATIWSSLIPLITWIQDTALRILKSTIREENNSPGSTKDTESPGSNFKIEITEIKLIDNSYSYGLINWKYTRNWKNRWTSKFFLRLRWGFHAQ